MTRFRAVSSHASVAGALARSVRVDVALLLVDADRLADVGIALSVQATARARRSAAVGTAWGRRGGRERRGTARRGGTSGSAPGGGGRPCKKPPGGRPRGRPTPTGSRTG